MRKFLRLLPVIILLFVAVPHAYAGLSEGCFPAVQCDTGQDYYGTSCQKHINQVIGPIADSCATSNPPGETWNFNCASGCYKTSIPVPPACPGGVMVNGNCLARLDVLKDNVPVTGVNAYKIYDGTDLTEVVHVGTAGCVDGEVAVSDTASASGWKCGAGGAWTVSGSDAYRVSGNVGIGTATPNEQLQITGNFSLPASTATAGVIKSGPDRFIHNYGLNNFFAGVNAGNFSVVSNGRNVGVGVNALSSLTSGDSNVGVGYHALYSNTDGYYNTANGNEALFSNTTGFNNTASGKEALYSNTTGLVNTAIGYSSLHSNTTGERNTAIGVQAGNSNISGSRNVFLGYQAGGNETGSDKLYIANTSTATPLIYGDFATGRIGIGTNTLSGKFQVVDSPQYVRLLANSIFGNTALLAEGENLAGYFTNTNGTSYALASSSDVGLVGGGNLSGGHFLDNNQSGLADVAVGDFGIKAYGNSAGGYFKDSNNSGYANVGYGDYGIWAMGNSMGGRFEDLDSGSYAFVGYSGYSLYGNAPVYVGTLGSPALIVNGAEALWYDGNYFSWGYGAAYNYFNDRVGIGQLAPTFKLQWPNVATDVGGRGRANAWTTYSDSRVKMNQAPLSYGLKQVLELEPKTYDHYSSHFEDGKLVLDKDYSHEVGFIAQEVNKVIPEAVNKPADENTELWGLDNDKLTPVLAKAIQELKAENDELKAVVCELKPNAKICEQ
ncbi:MAG: tail fiber domain-containing protein [Patescibacteria group bacterium]